MWQASAHPAVNNLWGNGWSTQTPIWQATPAPATRQFASPPFVQMGSGPASLPAMSFTPSYTQQRNLFAPPKHQPNTPFIPPVCAEEPRSHSLSQHRTPVPANAYVFTPKPNAFIPPSFQEPRSRKSSLKVPANAYFFTPEPSAFIPPSYADEPPAPPRTPKTPKKSTLKTPLAQNAVLSTPLFPNWGFYRDVPKIYHQRQIEMHPLLQPADMPPLPGTNNPILLQKMGEPVRATEFVWDIIEPPSTASLITIRNVTVPAVTYYSEPAMWPHDNFKTLFISLTPDIDEARKGLCKDDGSTTEGVRVDASGDRITVGDLLNAVYNFWQTPITKDEYRKLVLSGRLELTEDKIRDTAYDRIGRGSKYVEERERLEGYRRADLLAGRWSFGGLMPRYLPNRTWYLEMLLLPIQ